MRTLVLRTLGPLPWLLAAVLAAAPARAQETVPRVYVHGFGSWAYGNTNANLYLAGAPEGNYGDSAFSLNVSANVTDRLRVVSQLFMEETSEATDAKLDYAFAEWKFSDALKLRVGEVKLPFGLSTEVFDVGTLRPFLQLPQAIYGPIGFVGESYKGVGLTGVRDLGGGWELRYDAYGGGVDIEEFVVPEDFLRDQPVSNEGAEEVEVTKNVGGGRLILQTPVGGLSFGVSGYAGDEVGSDVRWVMGGHAEYLAGPWSIRSEYAHETVRERLIGNGFYLEAARRFGSHWQAAAQYDRLATELTDVAAPVAPSLLEHEEVALGLNYWFNPAFVLKLSYHRVDGNRLAAPEADELAAVVASGRLQKRTNLFQFGAQFSF